MREMVREFFNAPSERVEVMAMRHGQDNEPIAAYDYSRFTARTLEPGGFHVHPAYDWIGVSPDFLIADDGGLEIKCPLSEPEPPHPWYVDQCALCMEATFRDWWDLYQWTPEDQRVDVQFHDALWFPRILPQLEDFMAEYYRYTENPSLASEQLTPNVMLRNDDEWLRAVNEFREAKARNDITAQRLADARQRLINATEGYSTEGHGLRCTKSGNGWRVT